MTRNKLKFMGLLVSSALLVACGKKNVEHQVCIKGTVFSKRKICPFLFEICRKDKKSHGFISF